MLQVASALADIKGGPAQRMRVLYEALLGKAGEADKLASLLAAKKAYLRPHTQVCSMTLARLLRRGVHPVCGSSTACGVCIDNICGHG